LSAPAFAWSALALGVIGAAGNLALRRSAAHAVAA